ncbi:DUF1993 family protein [Dongia mobilis]|jgi:hypothetical protein|uniref:DUF1993 domain-containing protein n=1 Tax=Dongia sp. TaxID=1977262 RepID=UPI0026F2CF58
MIHKIVVSQFTKMLGNLSAILDKAAAFAEPKKIDMDVLLNARLAPDQFNLLRQIQIACDTANLGAARLTGKEATTPSFPDSEKTLAEIKARIASTIEILRKLSEADFADSATRRISQPRWEGKTLSGEEFLIQHVVPNFYFHLTTAYAILRHNGVDVGKKDYLGAMPYRAA